MPQVQTAKQINWKVGGSAGKGIKTTGLIFSKTCTAHGWQIFDYTEYPSLITSGHNTYQVLTAPDQALTQCYRLDVLVALDQQTLELHQAELDNKSLVIYDPELTKSSYDGPGHQIEIPLKELTLEISPDLLMANNVALGASVFLLGLDLELLTTTIERIFTKKGDLVVTANQQAAQVGWDYAQNNFASFQIKAWDQKDSPPLSMTGNEAISLGAIAGGLQFFASYPMTPSSSILHHLAAMEKEVGIVVKHAEDEIGTVNMVLGASFAGVRAMTATSGGGFCYMTEALGLSGVAELPLAIVESMRPGPALGMPTWTAQGDLQMVLNASQDEFPRLVLAPGDATEAFELTRQSLDLAEKYQLPVILLSDKYLSESRYTVELSAEEFNNQRLGFVNQPQSDEAGFFPRYAVTKDGLSPRSVPGQAGGTHVANSYEHDEYGIGTEESEVRTQQMNKRFAKNKALEKEILPQFTKKKRGAKLTLVGFGSTKNALIIAQDLLVEQKIPVNILNLSWLWPFPTQQVEEFITAQQSLVIVEGNSQGQLSTLITQQTGHQPPHSIRRYDGRPFYPEDIVAEVKNILAKSSSKKS